MISIDKSSIMGLTIIGTGGTGSHLTSFITQLLGNAPFKNRDITLTLVDGDIVEEKNLKTQKFLHKDINKNKAEVLSDRYGAIYDKDILYIDKYIQSEADINNLLMASNYKSCMNIIISCVDNNAARRIIDGHFNSYDHRDQLIYIDAGNSSGNGDKHGQVIVGYKQGSETFLPSISHYFPLEDEKIDTTLSCGEQMALNIQNIGANMTSALTVFNIVNEILSNERIPGDIFTFNATKVEAQSMQINKPKKKLSFVKVCA